MLRKIALYGSLTLFSALVGVFIAGGPGSIGSSEVIASVPSTTTTTTTTTPVPETSAPTTTTTSSTSTTTTTSTTIDATTTTSSIDATTTTTSPTLVERSELRVGVANGSGIQGIAGRFADALGAVGYVDATPLDAVRRDLTTVFHAPGLEAEAARLAADAGFAQDAVALFDELPELLTDGDVDVDLILFLGSDNEAPGGTIPDPAAGGG